LDLDPQALHLAADRLAPFGNRAILRCSSYTSLLEQLADLGWKEVDGIVFDLGLSSMQLDTSERGFSFLKDAPLDMRFGPDIPVTAAELVNQLPEAELADLIYRYGEERRARQVARAIVRARPIQTTGELAKVVSQAVHVPRHTGGIHPATRTFQALRIAVNGELEALEMVLPQALQALAPGGRLAVISFHSLEDRIVKQFLRREATDCLCPPRQPLCTCGHRATLRECSRQPLYPQESEVANNPRARSARLRAAQKLPDRTT
jgi:16S rRNA (cytosine1402-N4)-methyltransferase